jgi:DNA-binding transcriptional LysR family regulator
MPVRQRGAPCHHRWVISSRQLEYFRAVARELHFTRAAQALRVAQPALSQHIRRLERQLGVALFERDRHRVALTPAGAALLAHAERVLSDLAGVEDEMLGWAAGTRGRIRLGTARGLAGWLAALLADYTARHPAVELELREESTAEMLADLHTGRLDAATLATAPPDAGRLDLHPIGTEPLVLVERPNPPPGQASELAQAGEPLSPAGEPAGRAGPLPVAGLHERDLVVYSPGSAVREIVAAALAAAGAVPRVRFETREYATARALASAGLAAAVLPRSLAAAPGPPVHITVLDPEPTWTPVLAWPAGRRPGPALSAFLDLATRQPGFGAPTG